MINHRRSNSTIQGNTTTSIPGIYSTLNENNNNNNAYYTSNNTTNKDSINNNIS